MKKLIFLLLILVSFNVQAKDIKLSCRINLVTSFDNGFSETHQYNEIFTVTDNGTTKFIIPTSTNFTSVSTSNVLSNAVIDNSDSSRWSITNRVTTSYSHSLTTIEIDRNTGKIWYTNDYMFLKVKGNSRTNKGEGDFEKVDVSKKKF